MVGLRPLGLPGVPLGNAIVFNALRQVRIRTVIRNGTHQRVRPRGVQVFACPYPPKPAAVDDVQAFTNLQCLAKAIDFRVRHGVPLKQQRVS